MTDHNEYFEYLRGRSRLGALYRRLCLYPRLSARLKGTTLDLGCGIGDMLVFRRNTIGVDINSRSVEYCRSRGAEAYVMQGDALPFASGRFGSVLMDNVLEHIEQPVALLREVHRVLASRGRLLVGVPGSRGWDSDPDHKVRYDEAILSEVVGPQGFRLVEVFHTPLLRSRWLDRNMSQYCIYALFRRID